jgi:hypothetical protein
MELVLEEKISLTLWWMVAIGITIYLFLGAVDTIMVMVG